MRKIFIDCGAHDGCSVRYFFDHWEDAKEFEIFCFEPNPNLAKYHPVNNAKFSNKAVWIKNGKRTFYTFATEGGSTLVVEKSQHNINKYKNQRPQTKMKTIYIKCLDLSQWIKQNFSQKDYIILKLDIEGAEYAILQKILKDRTAKYLNELYCEFHNTRCGVDIKQDKYFKKTFKKMGLKITNWDAMTKNYLLEEKCSEYR